MAASSMNQMAGLERHHFGAWLRAGSPPRSTNKTPPTEGHQPGNKTCSDGKGSDIPSPSFTSSQNKGDTEVGISIENTAPAGLETIVDGVPLVFKGSDRTKKLNRDEIFNKAGLGAKGVDPFIEVASNVTTDGGTRRKGWKRGARSRVTNIDEVMVLMQLGKQDSVIVCDDGNIRSKKLKSKVFEGDVEAGACCSSPDECPQTAFGRLEYLVVCEAFLPTDKQAIMSIPSSTARVPDILCWHYDSSEISQSKVVIVLKACFDWIPTNLNLARRGVDLDPSCPLGCGKPESSLHAAWGCKALKCFRFACGVLAGLTGLHQLSMLDFLVLARAQLLIEELMFLSLLLDFQAAATSPLTAAVRDKPARSWSPPPPGSWKINTDAAVDSARGFIGLVEGAAFLRGIRFAVASGLVLASLESDAAAVVASVNRGSSIRSEFGLILHYIREALSVSLVSPVCFVLRVCSQVAHAIVKLAMSLDSNLFMMESEWSM
ncbi:hypothetical protein JRO89_XS10G0057200 [Xanthoceras sorbifolium]|uniref:RNase H type-1 domain-containing protein n=1 Tax=Xanthoceras sorbifolium TaxID=99658 RepID=A0ABQ8HHS6_9ROSI|nr:hypothetical protein JRO89_XS10G0057200 [Xanthoceras sorbifolium]